MRALKNKKKRTNVQTPAADIARRLSLYEDVYSPPLMVAALMVSWLTSYTGVLAMATWTGEASATTSMLALLISGVACGLLFALFHIAMRLVPRARCTRAGLIGMAVLLILMIALLLSSTYTSFIGLSLDSARGLHLRAQSEMYGRQARQLALRSGALIDFRNFIQPEAAQGCAAYEAELQSGVITGSRGKGLVTGHLLSLCTKKTEMAKLIDEAITANAVRLAEITELASQMDGLIFDDAQSIRARQDAFHKRARRIDQLLIELERSDRSKSLEASYAAIAGSIAGLENAQSGLAASQAAALDAMIGAERSSADAMDGLIEALRHEPRLEMIGDRRPPIQTLVWMYWDEHLPQLALALIPDLFAPLATLLFWAAGMKASRKPKAKEVRT